MTTASHTDLIDAFGKKYRYDVRYMHKLLEASPAGYTHFAAFLPMASYRDALPAEAYAVARIEAMRAEDCGPCLQLAIDQALEEGVSAEVLRSAWEQKAFVDPLLEDVCVFARAVAENTPIAPALADRLRDAYGEAGVAELGLCIASSRVFPAIKRALGEAMSCVAVQIKVSE